MLPVRGKKNLITTIVEGIDPLIYKGMRIDRKVDALFYWTRRLYSLVGIRRVLKKD